MQQYLYNSMRQEVIDLKRYLFITGSLILLGIGLLGIVVPILPTTPFLLGASYLGVRGSSKFDHWLKQSEVYNKYVVSYEKQGGLSLQRKIKITVFSSTMLISGMLITQVIFVKILLLCVLIIKLFVFYRLIPTVKNHD